MGDENRLFDKDVGTWDGDVEVRPYPGAEPQRSRGVMTNRVLGDRWLIAEFKNETGFEGHGIYGWDQTKQRYVGTWVDAMRGSLVIADGTFDRDARTMTYEFELSHAGRTIRCKDVTHFIDDTTQEFRSFIEMEPGKPHAVVTATYRKRA